MAKPGGAPPPLGKTPPSGKPPPSWEAGPRLPPKANPWGFAHDPAVSENTGKADAVLASPTVPCCRYQLSFKRAREAGLEMRGLLKTVVDTEQLAAHCLRVVHSQCFRGNSFWAWAILRGLPDDTGNEVRGLMWAQWSHVCAYLLEETGQVYHRAVFRAFGTQDESEEYWEAAMGFIYPLPVLPRRSPRQCDVGSVSQVLDFPCILP